MSSDYYGFIAGEIADSGGQFDRMTEGEIAAYFKDHDQDGPLEPDHEAAEYARHCEEDHGGSACDCPLPSREELDAAWAERARQHQAEDHGGGECDCFDNQDGKRED